jgi:ComF family protein
MKEMVRAMVALGDLLMPRTCPVCGRTLDLNERHLCLYCAADLPLTYFWKRSHNPMADRFNARIDPEEYEPYAYAAALFHYRAEAGYKKIPQALKYHRNFGAGRDFARLLGGRLAASPLYADVDLVVPVPLHRTRHWRRGYNQAAVIAREVARSLGASCAERLLERRRRTRSQARLPDKAARAANVAGAFSVRGGNVPAAGHILLIDDVFTTGATLAACHDALRHAYGPQVRISVATLGVVGE